MKCKFCKSDNVRWTGWKWMDSIKMWYSDLVCHGCHHILDHKEMPG